MPIHNWKMAPGGYFHHFHQFWTTGICSSLNNGQLPSGIYAMVEQYADEGIPDVLALQSRMHEGSDWATGTGGGVALAIEPPKSRFMSQATEEAACAAKANQVVLHHGDRIIAVIEIVSPGNKSNVPAFRQFIDKSVEFLRRGVHLLVVDLFPPTPRDPLGIHPAIWENFGDDGYGPPVGQQLTLAAYVASTFPTAYVEPVAVGDTLPEMPIFLDAGIYVRVPLEPTYTAAWNQFPVEIRDRIAEAVA